MEQQPPVCPPSGEPPSDPAAEGELQFDRAEFGEEATASPLQCTACNQAIAGVYYEINGAVACEGCQAKARALRTGGSALARAVWATIFGTVAGAAGAGIYYGISALTGYEFGLIAILVGFMVGFAVNFGSQQRGGWFYQLLAVGLTYCSIVSTYVPMIVQEMGDVALVEPAGAVAPESQEHPPAANDAPDELFAEDTGPDPETPPDAADTALAEDSEPAAIPRAEPEAAEELEAIEMPGVVFWIFVVVFAFVAPFLAGFENILGILIIGFGLWQAWQLNRKRPFEVSGPFQVAEARASS